MANHLSLALVFCFLLQVLGNSIQADSDDNRKVYVVYMGHKTQDHASTTALHSDMLQQVIGRDAERHIRTHYTKSFNGFSASLTDEEAQTLRGMEGVVSVFPSRQHQLHTTSSWDFMAFPINVNRYPAESDITIGVFDSGIWPESESFSDVGFTRPPAKWRGICQGDFPCNNKIIGARFFKADRNFSSTELQSPRDNNGHGTHTASTAAGNRVANANLLGLLSGTARGGVPGARIAVYKVCWLYGCPDEDVLSAFDTAISDGVDIISASFGSFNATRILHDGIAIGSYHAMKNNILTVQAAGNSGPSPQTTTSLAPWILSVAAGTRNPDLITPIRLGNGMVLDGVSVSPFVLGQMYPLVYAGDVPNAGVSGVTSRLCGKGSLDPRLVRGKIVLCDTIQYDSDQTWLAGAVGSIMCTPDNTDLVDGIPSYPFPVSVIDQNTYIDIYNYIKTDRAPTAIIMQSQPTQNSRNPYVASFSSRGPNLLYKSILKFGLIQPDITAPGVRILAAWPSGVPSDLVPGDSSLKFNVMSGTSMACPHVSGIAAYIKSIYPTWSPSALKSAIMTTAEYTLLSQKNVDAEFAYGAGYLNPMKAINPGLVYDAGEVDYTRFLCQQGYDAQTMRIITGNNAFSCSQIPQQTLDLNYPTFVIPTLRNRPVSMSFTRTATNVGSATSTYQAYVVTPNNWQITVQPNVLQFREIGQQLSFVVTVTSQTGIGPQGNAIVSASLEWRDGVHQVRSPMVVHVATSSIAEI